MGGEWKDCLLGDVVELKRGYDLPQAERLSGVVPLVSSSGVTDTHAKAMVKGPGVVTGRYGTIGQVFYVERDFWPLNTTLYVRDFKGNDPCFISYFLRNVDFFAYSDKAAVPGINRNHLHQARVLIPADLTEQRTIAHILGTLDEKIELNRKQNETLEAMTRAIFKAWFVDFEPVRAKMEGRWQRGQSLPGLPADLYDLFPDRLVETGLGEVPESWNYQSLSMFIEIHDSKRVPLSGKERSERKGIYPYHGAAGVMDSVDDYLFDGVYVLVGEDGSVVGENGCPVTQYVWGKFWVNNHAHVLRGRGISNEALIVFLDQCNVAPFVTGAVQPKLSQANLKSIPFLNPGNTLLKKFEQIIAPMFGQIRDLKEEEKSLTHLRDTLLPKLISGELRIPDAERIVGAAA